MPPLAIGGFAQQMQIWRPRPTTLVQVAVLLAATLAVLWLVPPWLTERANRAAAAHRTTQLAELAHFSESLVQSRLMAVERLLFVTQQGTATAAMQGGLGGLVRSVLVLQPGEERSFLPAGVEAPADLPVLLGRPRLGPADAWLLPALRLAHGEAERPVAAALDPRLLLSVPAMDGAGVMLLGSDGVVLAAAGALADQLGLADAGRDDVPGQLRRRQPIGGSGLAVVAMLPVVAVPLFGLLPALGLVCLLLALGFGLMLWQQGRRQQAAARAAASAAQHADSRLRGAMALLAGQDRRMGEVLAGLDLGACLVDSQLRLVAWNENFAGLAGVAPQALRPGLAMDELPAPAGREAGASIRAALRHRLGDMQDRRSGCAIRFRPDGSRVVDRWTTLEDGGLLLTCRLEAEPEPEAVLAPRRAPASAHALAELCAEELRKRLPLLLAAASAGDTTEARTEAHAMRGVAANFGLPALAESLAALEAAARNQQLPALLAAAQALPPQVDAALETLFSRAA